MNASPRLQWLLSTLRLFLVFVLLVFIGAPLSLLAESNDFYYCQDHEGRVTITNRHYDERNYRCTPFVELNKAFKQTETREKGRVPAELSVRAEREASLASESARMSADSARISMEAAQVSAQAAYLTAEAARRALTPYYIILGPR